MDDELDELPCCTEPLLPGWLTCTDGEVDEVCDESPGESGVVVVLSLPLVLLSPLGDASGCVVDEGSALLTGTVVDGVDASLCESPGLLDGDAANAGVAERISIRNARSATTRLARRSWQERRDESRAPLRKALPKTTTCRRTLSPREDPSRRLTREPTRRLYNAGAFASTGNARMCARRRNWPHLQPFASRMTPCRTSVERRLAHEVTHVSFPLVERRSRAAMRWRHASPVRFPV